MRTERIYYYQYKGPTKERKERGAAEEKYEFDSALLAGEGYGSEPNDWRQAYCVLVLGDNGCPGGSATKTPVAGSITQTAATVLLDVRPEGLSTKYKVEYGTSEAFGQTTSTGTAAYSEGTQSETVTLSDLQPCTIYHYQAEAENEANEGVPGLGGEKTFATECKGTARIRVTDVQREGSGEGGTWNFVEAINDQQGTLNFDPPAGCTQQRLEEFSCLEIEIESMSREIPEAFQETTGAAIPGHAVTVLGARVLPASGREFNLEYSIDWKAVYEEFPLKFGRGVVHNTYEYEIEWNAEPRS
jgi:hypothetical protein